MAGVARIQRRVRHRHMDLSCNNQQLCEFFRKPGAKTDYVSLSSLLNISGESGCDDSDNIVRLHEQIARLPEQDKALLLLWLDGLSYNDIAELMGFPINTIASRLHRVKEKLKSRLCN